MSCIDLINFGIAVGGLVISLLCLFLTMSMPLLIKRERWFFIVFFSFMILYVASDLVSQISLVFWQGGFWQLSKAAIFFESLFSSILLPMFTMYIIECADESYKLSPFFYASCSLWAVYAALLVIVQFTDEIYYITLSNEYYRGVLYPILLIPPALLMLLNLLLIFRKRNKLERELRTAFAIYLIAPLVCTIIQMMSYGILLIVLGTTVAALIMFIFLLLSQIDQYIKQREQIATQKANIAVLQMRPHFIYNTLTSIYFLCKKDPEKAQQVILDFTTYLRNNMSAITKEGDIPFKHELEHAKAYIAVELVRFEGHLYVEFDTPHTSFHIPPLTLQPIIENAIKHGLSMEQEPLYISVYTRKTDKGSEIIVEDTGIGFTSVDKSTPHIALENIRDRLEMYSGGTLTIEPRKQGGTVVTIFIPDKKHRE